MAWVKLCDKDGKKAEFHVCLYEEDSKIKKTGNRYSCKDGFISQTVEIENIPGEQTIHFPVAFPRQPHSCMVTKAPGELEHQIYATNLSTDSVIVHIPPNPFPPSEKIVLFATGY